MTVSSGFRRAVGVIAAAALLGAPDRPTAQTGSSRVVAVGDVHGSEDGLLAILRATGLIDESRRWTGGAATFVQTGDVTDRGAAVKNVLDIMRALGADARRSGGTVVPVLGNHEIMNLVGELRDVTPAICESFGGANAAATRDTAWRTYSDLVKKRSARRPGETPLGLSRTQASFVAAYQPGCVEYRLAFGPEGEYGRWLRTLPIAVKVEGSVFMHAGAPPSGPLATLDQLNEHARDEVRRFDRFHQRLVRANLAAPWFRLEDVLAVAAAEVRWTNTVVADAKARGEAPDLRNIDVDLVREAAEVLNIGQWSLLNGDGPLWYRGYALADDAELDAPLTGLLGHWAAERLVVGHTVNRDFKIKSRLGGRVFLIDTGMLAPVYKGQASALELQGGQAFAVYGDHTRTSLASAQ